MGVSEPRIHRIVLDFPRDLYVGFGILDNVQGTYNDVSPCHVDLLTPCQQLRPSSRQEHGNASSNHKLFIKVCTVQLLSRNLKSPLI